MKFDSLIFDLDGTLWDASQASVNGWNEAKRQFNLTSKDITLKDMQGVTGKPFNECVRLLFPELSNEQLMDFFPMVDRYEEEAIKSEGGIFYDGALEGLAQLSEAYRIFIVSNCTRWYLNLFFKKSSLGRFVEGDLCFEDTKLPKGQNLIKIIDKYKLKSTIYIGDTEGDKLASEQAGIPFGFASYGFGCAKSDLTFDSFPKITNYFLK